jgi:molybdate transport system regulatory protein
MQNAVTRQSATHPAAAFRLRVKVGDVIAIGPGKVALLEAVAATGSISAAARSLGMSYRRAWLLIEELESELRLPAVDSSKGGPGGGGSELTEVGRQVVEIYRRIEDKAAAACADDLATLTRLLASH